MTPWYAILMFAGLALSAWLWGKRFRAAPEMVVIYAAGLLGALLGAKLGYVLAEAPFERGTQDFWMKMLYGKTILGALMGGYLGVESGKKLIGYRAPTGDFFAFAVPAGLVLGRIGCLLHGCCVGVVCEPHWWTMTDGADVTRWPAPLVELLFNATAAVVLFIFAKCGIWRGQLFHVYLLAYAVFRMLHEPLRATPKYDGWFGPYQMIAGILFAFALWRLLRRQHPAKHAPTPAIQSAARPF